MRYFFSIIAVLLFLLLQIPSFFTLVSILHTFSIRIPVSYSDEFAVCVCVCVCANASRSPKQFMGQADRQAGRS